MESYNNDQRLKVGDEIPIKTGWLKKQSLIYAGMINDHTASIIINNTDAHNSWAYNLYVSKYPYEFGTKYGRVSVVHFNADELAVRTTRH